MDPTIWLLIVVIVISILLVGAILVLVIVFGHPDDKDAAYFPKAVTIFGLWLSFASLLILPYDVASSTVNSNAVRVDLLWQITYITLAVLISVLVPFAFFYYESDVDDQAGELPFFETQIGAAIKYTLITAIILVVILVIMFSYLATAQIPTTLFFYQSSYSTLNSNPLSANANPYPLVLDVSVPFTPENDCSSNTPTIPWYCINNYKVRCPYPFCSISTYIWEIPVSFPLYVVAFVAFIGWFFFVMFVGVGFIALPLDLINDFRYRPTPMSTKTYYEERANLGRRAAMLLEQGEKLQRDMDKSEIKFSQKRENNREYSNFEKNYYFLKKDYQLLYVSHQLKGGNPLWYFFKLFCGIVGLGLSLCWLLHIIIFMIPATPIHPFLNDLFVTLSTAIPGFPLFGVIFFALFSFYLLMCVVCGAFKLGVRFLFFKMYPMEVGNTLMNAFLFNTWIILFTSIPACQFCVYAFPYYTTGTQAQIMFGNQIQYMKFFKYFYLNNVFVISIIAVSALTVVYLSICPNNRAAKVDKALEKLAKSSGTSIDPLDLNIKIK